MALQSSGQIDISDIQTELGSSSGSLRTLSAAAGKSVPDAMSEFYGYSSFSPSGNFAPVTYTGNNSTQSITTGFQPDLVWIKSRNSTDYNVLFDSVRGNNFLSSNTTSAEDTTNVATLASYDSNGFTTGNDNGTINGSGDNLVAWCWKAGNGTSSNTSGSVTSTVSANDAAGFSIVKWTTISQNATAYTVGHGLSAAPDLIIVKDLDLAVGWHVYSSAFSNPEKEYLQFNLTDALYTNNTNIWNNTAATSSVWSMKSGYAMGAGNDCIAYCFRNISGYQKVGSYTGNGASTNSITTGFQPRFLIVKCSSQGNSYQDWFMHDSSRTISGGYTNGLNANSNAAEFSNTGTPTFNSNGFTINTSGGEYNASGQTYIYLAIA